MSYVGIDRRVLFGDEQRRKHEALGKTFELGEGWREIVLERGKMRFVHVNKEAIQANLRKKKNYPTCIVVEDGKILQFHAVRCDGLLAFGPRPGVRAPVYLTTFEAVSGYVDLNAEQVFVRPKRYGDGLRRRLQRGWEAFRYGLGYVPILSCLLFDEHEKR